MHGFGCEDINLESEQTDLRDPSDQILCETLHAFRTIAVDCPNGSPFHGASEPDI
jgi:hypothetical protein